MGSVESAGKPRTAIVVGAGIAGIACALRLAEQGVAVTLIETRKKLGGRATSFTDVRSNLVLDNCQHVVLGCCTNYMDLLARLDRADRITWYTEQFWIETGGRVSTVRRGALPAPAHFSLSFLAASFLSAGEKILLARACGRIMRVDRRGYEHTTFADFLHSCGQTERIIRRFWQPVIVSACNLDVARVSASAALHVFQEGFLAAARSADIGVSTVPLVELYDLTVSRVERAGGKVLLGEGAASVTRDSVLTTSGLRLCADAVICAVPVERVNRLVDDSIRAVDPRFAPLERFTHSPILGVHLEFDRNVMSSDHRELPHAVLVDRPTQWLFRKNAEGTYVHAVISAADDWLALTEEQIAQRVLADLTACLPSFQPRSRADSPQLIRARAVKEKLATFAPVPGLDASRPASTGPSGVILAGDYTHTGWPATMEGATRSGYAAAAAALAMSPAEFVLPPLKIAPLSRLLGLRAVQPEPSTHTAALPQAPTIAHRRPTCPDVVRT